VSAQTREILPVPDRFRKFCQRPLWSGCALLVLLTQAVASVEPLCLRVEDDERLVANFSIHPGDDFFLSFPHSLYGSIVEEQFFVIGNHFQLGRARYQEARLVEFYGHENAQLQEGWWLVELEPREVPSLELGVSQDARFELIRGNQRISLSPESAAGGFFRLRIGSCAE
jgi:hypothetical protein